MELFLFSLKISTFCTAGMAVLLGVLVTPRLYMAWRRMRLMTCSMPCQDAQQVRFRIGEAFKGMGQPGPSQPDGSFAVEPANWRKKFGLKPITVVFSQPNLAVVTGQAQILKPFAGSQKLPLSLVPDSTFGAYLKSFRKPFYGLMGFVYVGLFLAIMIGDPDHLATHKPGAPAKSVAVMQQGR